MGDSGYNFGPDSSSVSEILQCKPFYQNSDLTYRQI